MWQQRGATFEAFQKIRECVKVKVTTEEISGKLFLATDNKGRTVLYMAANGLLQEILDWAEENLTTEEIKNILLLATDFEKMTAWHVAARWGKPELLQKIRDLAEEKLTAEEIKNK
jgi:hypothetical protein